MAPYWLFAASAVLIPVAIHLWNIRQGKTVKIGSIRWLEASASKQFSRIKLTDVWLLLLRCLILLLLAIALAKPVINMTPGTETGQKAIYISPELLYSKSIATLKPTIDPLLQRGYTLHAFTPEFNVVSQEQWQNISTKPSDSVTESGNYWELLPALAQKYTQPQDSIWLFTSDQQRHFQGSPVPLQENIEWITVALEPITTWLQAAYATPTDSILLLIGKSTRESTTFRQHQILKRVGTTQEAGNLSIRLMQQQEGLWAYWGKDTTNKVAVRQKPIAVSIKTDQKQKEEEKYLRAAFTAIGNYTGVPINVQPVITEKTDWIFWLSSTEIPDSVKAMTAEGTQLWLQPGTDPFPTAVELAMPVNNLQVHQLAPPAPEYESIIWSASNGEPVLTAKRTEKANIYFFRGGFTPAWSNLGQSALLPELLMPLLLSNQLKSKYDVRALPEEVLSPAKKALQPTEIIEKEAYSLIVWFVLAAFVLFFLERLIAGKRVKI